jgi:prophage tail gpP-like protein
MVGKATEQATLIINGQDFIDWETVLVRHAARESPAYRFRFTCSEAAPIAQNWGKMQIRPGDDCQIKLAGEAAFTGKVSTRQVYYDKSRHYVEIQGASPDLALTAASPVTKTMEMKNVDFSQIARQLLQPFGMQMVVEGGTLPTLKFPRVSLTHGLSVFDHLDLYSRAIGAAFTSNPQGQFVALMGPSGGSDTVIEGQNILVGREIIYNPSMESIAPTAGQGTANDQKWGPAVASSPFVIKQMLNLANSYQPFTLLSELPTSDNNHLNGRVGTEHNMMKEDRVTVFATVYGWLRPSGGLWQRNQTVHVKSPMLIMDDDLTAKSVTFTQDNNEGTRTTLELCNPLAFAGGVPEA